MKKTVLLLACSMMSVVTTAQVKTPQLSPFSELEQTVGLTEIEVEYSRPSLRGRDMHKEIIPFGKIWRFGANKSTTISFDTPVSFGGHAVKEGTYEVYATPGAKEWSIVLYDGEGNWGVPKKWDDSKVVAELKVAVKKSPHKVETFTISFDNLTINHFDLNIAWGNSVLPIKVKLPTEKLAVTSIEKTMKGSPSERDYYSAASYYLNSDMRLDKALVYIDKAMEMNDDTPFYYVRKKALIQAAMENYEDAIKTANVSLEMAKKAGSDEYVRKNEQSIKEWSR